MSNADLPPKTLLIVDNNPLFIHLLRDTLDTCGGHRIVVIPCPDTARRYLVEAAALDRLPLGVAVRSVPGDGPGTATDWLEWLRTEPAVAGRCPLIVIGPGAPLRAETPFVIRVPRPTTSSLRGAFLRM